MQLTAETAIDFILDAGGNFHLAAERIAKATAQKFDIDMLMALLTKSNMLQRLNTHLRTMLHLKMFVTLMELNETMNLQITELTPREAVNLYATLIAEFNSATVPAPQTTLSTADLVARTRHAAQLQGINPDIAEDQLRKSIQLTQPTSTNGQYTPN